MKNAPFSYSYKKQFLNMIYCIFTIALIVCIFKNPAQSALFAATGLSIWFEKMIPSLFPFMILSGILVRLKCSEFVASLIHPIFKRIFRVSKNGCYCILTGFLCGFPMGAKTIADLLEQDRLTLQEGAFLLSFCNSIGPVYFCSIILPLYPSEKSAALLIGMYLIPLLYGCVLRWTVYRNCDFASITHTVFTIPKGKEFMQAMEASMQSAINSIVMLGGYMILFNLCNIITYTYAPKQTTVLSPLLEISGGISNIGGSFPLYALSTLVFGGVSCIAQTYSCIKNTKLSIGKYIVSKLLLTVISTLYFAIVLDCF